MNAASDLKMKMNKQKNAWLKSLRRLDLANKNIDYMRVCSVHFKSGKPAKYQDENDPDWCPTLNMGYCVTNGVATSPVMKRYQRATKRKLFTNKINEPNTKISINNDLVIEDIENEDMPIDTGISSSTEMTMMDIQTLQNDSIKPGLTSSNQRLSEFQKLLLCLMKLRLNLPFVDLGYRFNITCSAVSNIFRKVIYLLEHMFKKLIYWPDRQCLRTLMPRSFFNAFGNSVAVIIDCFEIGIEKPSNLKARAQTWSSYKNKNTVKYLIAITPQGIISYISEGWGGRVSDKHITENCDFLENLLPGDIVLADRGFTINESIGFHYATLKTPAFTKGQPQLHPCSIEETRKIASVRIHVERVIGLTRSKYKILNGPVQIT
ncbi:PREDICTED: uncharacterized protein LOC107167328 [Diuraphis noxia]|uniref:uncharacterized protein LOC107167328 n=1 Tax=Diuraphis noxia TaxID=143948 RepID=UPI000763A269|nr:PREDICTED: uncharacterized protein LOC107167328 [Diuraphis noxia]